MLNSFDNNNNNNKRFVHLSWMNAKAVRFRIGSFIPIFIENSFMKIFYALWNFFIEQKNYKTGECW